jgi:hypothetical protein
MSDARKPGGEESTGVLELPPTVDLQSVDRAEIAVIEAAARRRITSREALDFTLMLDRRRRAIADVAIEARLDEIEARRKRRERGEDS